MTSAAYLQSTDGANELLYWDADGRRMPTATDFRDTQWARWTATLGIRFSTPGLSRYDVRLTGRVLYQAGQSLVSGHRTVMARISML